MENKEFLLWLVSIIGLIFILYSVQSKADALSTGKRAYNCLKHRVNQTYVVVDYSRSKYQKRFYLIDGPTGNVIRSYLVSQGSGGISNRVNSHASSIGVYITSNQYYGKHGLAMRLDGLDNGFNNNARRRAIVIHGANYVNESIGRVGSSWGCFVLDKRYSSGIIKRIGSGTLLVAYYPNQRWLNSSKYLNCGGI